MGDGRWAMGAARPIAAERRLGGAPYNGIVIPSKAASVWGNRVLA